MARNKNKGDMEERRKTVIGLSFYFAFGIGVFMERDVVGAHTTIPLHIAHKDRSTHSKRTLASLRRGQGKGEVGKK